MVAASVYDAWGRAAGLRLPALVGLLALAFGAAPAASQADSTRLAAPVPPRLDGHDGTYTRDFWRRVQEEARRFRELNGGITAYARRYRISPELAHSIHAAARDVGIDPELGFRLVRAESGFNPRARSRAGALGLTQLMPSTARWLDSHMTTPGRIMEPDRNLRVGFGYLRRLLEKYDGDLALALLAYNRGEGAVDRDLRRGRDPENGYTRMVLGRGLDRYRGSPLGAR